MGGKQKSIDTWYIPAAVGTDAEKSAQCALHTRHIAGWRPRIRRQKHECFDISASIVLATIIPAERNSVMAKQQILARSDSHGPEAPFPVVAATDLPIL